MRSGTARERAASRRFKPDPLQEFSPRRLSCTSERLISESEESFDEMGKQEGCAHQKGDDEGERKWIFILHNQTPLRGEANVHQVSG